MRWGRRAKKRKDIFAEMSSLLEEPAAKPPSDRKVVTQAKRSRMRFMDAEKRGENPYQATANRIAAMAKAEKFAGTRLFLSELLVERPHEKRDIEKLIDLLDPQLQELGYAGPTRRLERPPRQAPPSRGYSEPAPVDLEPGELVRNLPGVLLAKKWTGRGDLTCYWMSEKLDGVRAIWDGEAFWSRNWNPFYAPEWFKKKLPKNVVLDGELWAGRGQFRDTISTVRRKVPNDPMWRGITYMVFDAPMVNEPFEKRMRKLKTLSKKWPDFVQMVAQRLCVGEEDLTEFHRRIAQEGGEGVMLRLAGSAYETKRSSTLYKVKGFHDEEARVTGHERGMGRHLGRLGAYRATLLSTGAEFKVGTGLSDEQRANPLPVGTIITVRYQELTDRGIPRFPSFIGTRDYE
jgi:DNA ligase-1